MTGDGWTVGPEVAAAEGRAVRVAVVGASGKLGQHLVRHSLARGHDVVGVCREESVPKLADIADRITVLPGRTDDADVVDAAVRDADAVLTVLVPWGMTGYSTGTAQAVLDHAGPGARLVFSCGWHISRDGRDVLPLRVRAFVAAFGPVARLLRVADLRDQVRACERVFASGTRWTVVRGSDLEEGPSQGLPIWRDHVGDPALRSNLTRRVDFAEFMVHAVGEPGLVRRAPAICGRLAPSAVAVSATA